MKGFLFGFVDNSIVAISAILGLEIDKYFSGRFLNGAIYGALIGHTISDVISGYIEFDKSTALNMGLGCFTVIVLVFFYFFLNNFYKKNFLEKKSDGKLL